MENNSNAIAEIQKKYAGCNLLMPAATESSAQSFLQDYGYGSDCRSF